MAIRFLRGVARGQRKGKRPGGFVRDDKGGTALEFALVAPIFFTALLAIFEVAMLFGTSVLLESAANRAARAVRTGQIYTATLPGLNVATQKTLFEDAMCNELILIDCADLSYDVQVYTNFNVATVGVHCDTDGAIDSPSFAIGLPQQVVVVTVVYPYEPIIPNPLIYAGRDWKSAAEGGCNGLSMQSIMVFRNEPFPLTL